MNQISRIYEALLNRREKICGKQEIVGIAKEYKKKFRAPISLPNTIKYLSRHKYIKRIFKSYYYINSVDERKRNYCHYEDKELLFTVLNKLGIKWYLGLGSALYLSGRKWQVPLVIHILNNEFSGKGKILSLNVKFSKVKESLFFGLKKAKTKNNAEYYYSSPVKTSLDAIYLKMPGELIKNKDVKKYLRHYPKWVGKK